MQSKEDGEKITVKRIVVKSEGKKERTYKNKTMIEKRRGMYRD